MHPKHRLTAPFRYTDYKFRQHKNLYNRPMPHTFKQSSLYRTEHGAAYVADSLEMLAQLPDNSVNLVMTSPPFALQRQKEYGNKDEYDYIDWLAQFANLVFKKLKDDGSFVIDLE